MSWEWKNEDYRGGWGWQKLVDEKDRGIIVGYDETTFNSLRGYKALDAEATEKAPEVYVLGRYANLIRLAPELLHLLSVSTMFMPKELRLAAEKLIEECKQDASVSSSRE